MVDHEAFFIVDKVIKRGTLGRNVHTLSYYARSDFFSKKKGTPPAAQPRRLPPPIGRAPGGPGGNPEPAPGGSDPAPSGSSAAPSGSSAAPGGLAAAGGSPSEERKKTPPKPQSLSLRKEVEGPRHKAGRVGSRERDTGHLPRERKSTPPVILLPSPRGRSADDRHPHFKSSDKRFDSSRHGSQSPRVDDRPHWKKYDKRFDKYDDRPHSKDSRRPFQGDVRLKDKSYKDQQRPRSHSTKGQRHRSIDKTKMSDERDAKRSSAMSSKQDWDGAWQDWGWPKRR